MGNPNSLVQSPDRLTRSVWVAVDPRDLLTGLRVTVPLRVTLEGQTARPVQSLSGVYCFNDLNLAPDTYSVHVEPFGGPHGPYFSSSKAFNLAEVPVPGNLLVRNPVTVELMPRPSYSFGDGATLARGRVVAASDRTPVEGALVKLFIDANDEGVRTQTDERGDFAVLFPTPLPAATGGPKTFTFTLRFLLANQPDHVTGPALVEEGKTTSLGEIQFAGI